jgi:hypothetical protein
VIVNNFVLEEFVDACLNYADSIVSSGEKATPTEDLHELEKNLDKEKLKVHASKNARLKVLVLGDR